MINFTQQYITFNRYTNIRHENVRQPHLPQLITAINRIQNKQQHHSNSK